MAIRPTRCALTLFFACSMALAPRSTTLAAKADDTPATLPITRVVLFTSGVGFFEHQGKVQDNADIDLKFNVADVNDLLKSMVLEDQGGGRISTVTYGSRDPITKTLKTFSVDLTREPTIGDLLRQVRGERVTVELPTPVTGKILGVELREQKVGKDEVIEVEMLNLVTPTGLRSIRLDSAGEIRLVSDRLNAELQDALAILTESHSRDKKNVTLRFLGAGERPVRVGYIQEAPLWKTSYRLVLKDDDAPLLQGWAIVENTTEHDWQDVRLTLVNGRPISFIMDLYQPLYVARPVVAPETFASLRPQLHNQDMAAAEQQFLRAGQQGRIAGGMGGGMLGGMGGGMGGGQSPTAPTTWDEVGGPGKLSKGVVNGGNLKVSPPIDPAAGVRSAAKGDDVGELFRYQIDEPVQLARQQSAMLAIVNDKVKGEKVSLFNPTVQSKHPLNAVQLTNTTALHLMQGPITVFDGGEYAGDARIEDLAPGGRRLISYALDLDTEITVEEKSADKQLVSARLLAGTLLVRNRFQRSHKYVVKNSGSKAKNVLLEQPDDEDEGWKLVGLEPTEKTRSLYRFAVKAEPGKPAKLTVKEEKPVDERFLMSTLTDPQDAAIYLNAGVISAGVKQAIGEVIRRNRTLGELSEKIAELEGKVDTIEEEQNRIRPNMAQLDHDSDLYRRYVKKLDAQEDEVEKLRPQTDELEKLRNQTRADLERYLEKLTIE
jgi:hypothetical protein